MQNVTTGWQLQPEIKPCMLLLQISTPLAKSAFVVLFRRYYGDIMILFTPTGDRTATIVGTGVGAMKDTVHTGDPLTEIITHLGLEEQIETQASPDSLESILDDMSTWLLSLPKDDLLIDQ